MPLLQGGRIIMDSIKKMLLEEVADLHSIPTGAFNIRLNGQADSRQNSEHIEIVPPTFAKDVCIRCEFMYKRNKCGYSKN